MYNSLVTKVEAILQQAHNLSPAEREELVHCLAAQIFGGCADDEASVGRRGLAAWTESVQAEDWSMYYPDSLRNGESSHP